ncbi:MAG: DUF2059 domain-containing protein [Chitinophagales bacterium]
MKKVIGIILLLGSMCSNLHGQNKKEYSAALVDLFKATGTDKTYIVAMESVFDVMEQAYSDVPDEFWSILEEEMRGTSLEELADLVTPVYMEYLSLDDIKAITTFFDSPVGQKYAESAADIYSGCVAVGEEWGERLGKMIVKKIEDAGY